MSRFYCPFCSSHLQFHKTSSDGVLICGLCGEQLMKKPLINVRKIFGLLLASAFLTPLLIMIIVVIQDFTKEKFPTNSEPLAILIYM